jgi:hypothetical protein
MEWQNGACRGITIVQGRHVIIEGQVDEVVDNDEIFYIAASPANHRQSFTGSGLPFASPRQAFENSPNEGAVKSINGRFQIKLLMPNSYYKDFNGTIVNPTVIVYYMSMNNKQQATIVIDSPIPYRSLTYPRLRVESQQMFYESGWRMPVRTQEQVLRNAGYPSVNYEAETHWGLKPPM